MPEDLSQVDVMDGGYEYLTIFTEDQSKTSGGSNPDNETLNSLSDQIFQIVPENTITSFNEGIERISKQTRFSRINYLQ